LNEEVDLRCELCGKEAGELFTCQICGKKVCLECVRIITKPVLWNLSSSTFPIYSTSGTYSVSGTASMTISFTSSISTDDEDIIICKSCADLLKLTLRVAKTKYERNYNG